MEFFPLYLEIKIAPREQREHFFRDDPENFVDYVWAFVVQPVNVRVFVIELHEPV